MIESFSPEQLFHKEKNETDWIINKVKNAATKRNHLLQQWATDLTDFNRYVYKKQFSYLLHPKS